MDIKVRGMDPKSVQKIDEMAKKSHLSRNQYLRVALENFAVKSMFESFEDRYQKLVEQQGLLIEENTRVMQRLDKLLEAE